MARPLFVTPFQDCLRSAVKTVIDYVQSGYRSFTYRPKCDVKRYVISQSDKGEATGMVLKSSLPFLKSDECERLRGQLSYIVLYMKEKSHPQKSLDSAYNAIRKASQSLIIKRLARN